MLAISWEPLTTDSSQNVFLEPFLTACMRFCCGGKLGKAGGLWQNIQRRLQIWPLHRVSVLGEFLLLHHSASLTLYANYWRVSWAYKHKIYTNISDSYYIYLCVFMYAYMCINLCLHIHAVWKVKGQVLYVNPGAGTWVISRGCQYPYFLGPYWPAPGQDISGNF